MHVYCKQHILRTYRCTDKSVPTALCLGTQVPRQNPRVCVWPSIMTTPTLLHTGSVRYYHSTVHTCIYDASYKQGHSLAFKNGISSKLPKGSPPSCAMPPHAASYFPQTPFLEILPTHLTLAILAGCNLQILGSTLRQIQCISYQHSFSMTAC